MYRVLLVDDEALIREGVSENVSWNELGYELAASCQNGKEALEYIQNHTVDVVLTDICMPFVDGMELSKVLSLEFPRIKVIILSGYDDFEYARMAVKYRVEDYILKPVTASELGEILTRVKAKMDGERKKEQKLYQGQLMLRKEALWNLMIGGDIRENILKEGENGVNIYASDFMAAIVQIDLFAQSHNLNEAAKKESALMAFVVHNICDEILVSHHAGTCVQGKEHRTCILFWTNKPREFKETVEEIGEEIVSSIKEAMGLEVTIGLGTYVKQLSQVYQSYEEAEKALGYRYILGTNRMIDLEKIRKKGEGISEGTDIFGEILLMVKAGETERISNVLMDITKYMQHKMFQKEKTWYFMQQAVEELAGQFKDSTEEEEKLAGEKKDEIIKSILSSRSLEEAMDFVESYCLLAAETIKQRKNTGGMKYAIKAVDYIEKNYGDSNLNLNTICKYLNISTSRFSSIFKSVTGETFMEALIRIRMQKAKELLTSTDFKNYEIAEKIGFSDPHYFSVAFKKMTGKTPTQYAEKGAE